MPHTSPLYVPVASISTMSPFAAAANARHGVENALPGPTESVAAEATAEKAKVSRTAADSVERQGSRVRALCSADGEEWFTAGEVEFPAREGEQAGVHAIGMIDRTH